jgi:anti-sigma factor RsiW
MFRRRKDIVCRQAVELVTDYLEDALSPRDRARLETHLAGCPHCHEYFAQMRMTISVMGRVEPESLTPEARDDLVALFRRWQEG